jgi:hypothetical protein
MLKKWKTPGIFPIYSLYITRIMPGKADDSCNSIKHMPKLSNVKKDAEFVGSLPDPGNPPWIFTTVFTRSCHAESEKNQPDLNIMPHKRMASVGLTPPDI